MTLLSTYFFVLIGILLQGFLLLTPNISWKKFLGVLALGLIAFLPSNRIDQGTYNLAGHLFVYGLVFILFYTAAFMDRILPKISEQVLLGYTAIYWFMRSDTLDLQKIFSNSFAFLLFLFPFFLSFATVFIAITKEKYKSLSLWLYIWYIFLISFFTARIINWQNLELVFRDQYLTSSGAAISLGMILLYFSAHLIYLFNLVPWPNRHKPYSQTLKEWQVYLKFLKNRFQDTQAHISLPLTILVTLSVLVFINTRYRIFSEQTLINVCIIILPLMADKLPKVRQRS